jgi:hypothetical protein
MTNYIQAMNWMQVVLELRERGCTLGYIAETCGLSSKGHVHDIASGKQRRVLWEAGDALLKLHKRVMRRKGKS